MKERSKGRNSQKTCMKIINDIIVLMDNFMSSINEFAVCIKLLYPRQHCKLETSSHADLLFNDLVELSNMVCTCCSSNTKKKHKVPTQAFWSKMDIMSVPPELKNLSDIEQ